LGFSIWVLGVVSRMVPARRRWLAGRERDPEQHADRQTDREAGRETGREGARAWEKEMRMGEGGSS